VAGGQKKLISFPDFNISEIQIDLPMYRLSAFKYTGSVSAMFSHTAEVNVMR